MGVVQFDFSHTWAEGITSQLLDALALAYGAAIERGRVGAAARALLVTAATATVAYRPLGPRRPSSVHWKIKRRNVCVAVLIKVVI